MDLGGTEHWASAPAHSGGTFRIRGYDLGAAPQGAGRMLAEFVRERFEIHPKAFGEIEDWMKEKGIESSFWACP